MSENDAVQLTPDDLLGLYADAASMFEAASTLIVGRSASGLPAWQKSQVRAFYAPPMWQEIALSGLKAALDRETCLEAGIQEMTADIETYQEVKAR